MKKEVGKAVRSPTHPILAARTGEAFWWESNGIFNAGVAEYKGKIMLLYRAYDTFRISRLGLAESDDGIMFTQHPLPAIDTKINDPYERIGIEDPRVTKIDDTYYIVHTSASYYQVGHSSDISGVIDFLPWRVRIGMHSTKDFKKYKHHGVILNDIPAKNGTLLPEKINDSFALFYRQHINGEDILKVSYTRDFKEWFGTEIVDWPRAEAWQQAKFGIGSQPISTPAGFLMVYHAVDTSHVYRLGLMMIDRDNPTKILWHSNPILEPETEYEKEGFIKNVVYCCGAIIRGKELWIYYGSADRVMGRAVIPVPD